VVVGLAAPSASANCQSSKSVSTYNSGLGQFTYWYHTLEPPYTLVAKMWQPGGADVTGTCNTRNNPDGNAGILYFAGASHAVGLNVNLSDGCVQPTAACANGQLAIMATVTGTGNDPIEGNVGKPATQFLMSQAPEGPGTAVITFDFSGFSSPTHQMVPIPRAKVTTSSRVGGNVNVTVGVDVTEIGVGPYYEGTAGLATGYNILSAQSALEPGRDASAYTLRSTITAPGGAPGSSSTTVDCTNPNIDQWVVTQLVTPGGPSPTVSQPTRVNCNPALADPKFKIVPKKGIGNRPDQR
jgi:hypothetical protein